MGCGHTEENNSSIGSNSRKIIKNRHIPNSQLQVLINQIKMEESKIVG